MIVIEHNLKVQNSADWVVDMGPEGGGDEVVAEGAPEQIARTPRLYRPVSEAVLARRAKGGRRMAE